MEMHAFQHDCMQHHLTRGWASHEPTVANLLMVDNRGYLMNPRGDTRIIADHDPAWFVCGPESLAPHMESTKELFPYGLDIAISRDTGMLKFEPKASSDKVMKKKMKRLEVERNASATGDRPHCLFFVMLVTATPRSDCSKPF